jgi:hypothetical protein
MLRIGNSMRFLVLLASLLAVPVTQWGQEKPEQAAQKAAERWLALIDAGKYGESWEQAAEYFQSAVTKDAWKEQVSAVRDKMGKLRSRTLKSAQYSEHLPNAPVGKYVVIQYESSFDAGPVIETVVPMQEKDGSWKVSGYFVKPVQRKSQ